MNGSQPMTDETLIDGAPANTATFNAPGYVPSVGAVQEFKVQNANFTAEFGRTGGGVVNLIRRSTTHKWASGRCPLSCRPASAACSKEAPITSAAAT